MKQFINKKFQNEMKSKEQLKQEFKNQQKPDENDFSELIESYFHKDEPITLEELLQLKTNLATIDKTNDGVETLGNVDTKEQVNAKINFAINALKANAPETYDTLKEIADYIAGDTNAEAALIQLINTKLDKPNQDGSWVITKNGSTLSYTDATNFGKNISNADLSNLQSRKFTQNASFTWETLGNPHILSGLNNKNTDISNFRKVRVQNTSGLDAIVDSKNLLIDGMASMTDYEKDSWRLANRKTNETYSTGSPQVDAVLPPVINGNETFNQFITVVGLNLFVNNSSPSTAILEIKRVKDIDGNSLSIPDVYTGLNIEVNQNNPTLLSTSINFSTMPKGYYKVYVTHNGITNLTSPEFFVGNAISTVSLPSPFWNEPINTGIPMIVDTKISSGSSSPTTYKSSVVIDSNLLQNGFISEFICEFSGSGSGNGTTGSGTFGIIGNDNTIYGIRMTSNYAGQRNALFMPDASVMNTSGTIGLTNKIYIIYKNDIVTIINQTTGKVKSFIDPSFKTTDKKAYYSMTGISGSYSNSGSMTFNNTKSF